MRDQHTVILIEVMAVSFCTSILFAFMIIRRVKMKQGGLLRADISLPNGLTPGKEVTKTWNGTTYFQLYIPGGKNVPSSYAIKIECPSSGFFCIGRKTGFDRFFKSVDITKEIQTWDKDFDSTFFIKIDAVDFTRAFFMDSCKSRAVNDIFEHGFTRVEHDGNGIGDAC